jgi:hypothetical protein
VDSNTNVAHSKILLDPHLAKLLDEKRKINPDIFQGDPKKVLMDNFFGALLEML